MSKYILSYLILSQASGEPSDKRHNYKELLKLSLLFYEAQRSGKLPASNKIPWRGDSALNDRGDNGEDLTGGYYDASDYVKQGFTIAYTISVLSWGMIAYEEGYRRSGQYEATMDAVRWGADYLVRCHVAPDEFYAQVGNFQEDHKFWGRPEELNMSRPAYKIDKDRPGTDVAAEAAAALAASSIVFSGSNRQYSQTLLKHSKQLFDLARIHKGRFLDTYPMHQEYFENEDFGDELAWAAIWLYRATRDGKYSGYARKFYGKYGMGARPRSFFYNTKTAGVQIIMAQVYGTQKYIDDATAFCKYAMNHEIRTPKGLVYIEKVGTLAHAANIAFICLQVGEFNGRSTEYIEFAKQQLDYIVGAKGGISYVVGFGDNYPKQPHHAASSCRDRPEPCNWEDAKSPKANPKILYGALVSGPNQVDYYMDLREEYLFSEVTIDYNAGFQGLLAGLTYHTYGLDNS